MNRPIRIGLIAEGEAELGASIPYIKPEDGGKIIERQAEGALHTLIRRELTSIGFDCDFVQRHPTNQESGIYTRRTGHSILQPKYLAKVVIAWKPEEVDIILIVVDADNVQTQRLSDLQRTLQMIESYHLDAAEQEISDRSAGGLAIKNFETWLLADTQTISRFLGVELQQLDNLEDLNDTKEILESAIEKSTYSVTGSSNQRPLQVRWDLASQIDLANVKTCCPNGYAAFVQSLIVVAKVVDKILSVS
jgi:hypothetical protein